MTKTIRAACCLAVLLFGVVAVATADSHDPTVYVWINSMKAKPGQGEALTRFMIEEDGKNFDPLVESGTAIDWGIAMPVVHDGKDPATHIEWIAFVGWDGVDQFMNSFVAQQRAMSPEEMVALDEKFDAMVEPGSHSDMINRSIQIGSGVPVRAGYIHLAYWSARAGKAADAKTLYDEVAVPVYDQLVADGKIQNYGLQVPALHRGQNWTHMGWYMSEGLAARDAVRAAFDAADAARSEEENKDQMARAMETFEIEHEEQILLVVHHKVASSGAE